MVRKASRRSAVFVLLVFVTSLLGMINPVAANAADSIPPLQWPPVNVGYTNSPLTGPSGSITIPCNGWDTDLTTYSATGQVVRDIDRASTIDGVPDCINWPIVDKNDNVYGFPGGLINSRWVSDPNLVAYSGNTVKWKYPANCKPYPSSITVGADGNIYALDLEGTEVHLIGLKPDLTAGQSQPTPVLDVVLQGQADCSVMLFPYKDGLVVYGTGFNGARFYSYGGSLTAEDPGASSWGGDPINSSGQVFHAVPVRNQNGTGFDVQVFDPQTSSTVWTAAVSTAGANVNNLEIHPTANGGVAALVQEQKLDASGQPILPTQWVTTLTLLSNSGARLQSFPIPDTYSSGSTTGTYAVWQQRLLTDTQGRITLVRPLTLNSVSGSPSTVQAVDIAVYDPGTGTWPYHQIMSGDLAAPGGAASYIWYERAVASVTNGTVFLEARCQGNCTDTNTKLYALGVPGVGMDYPRGDVLAASTGPLQPDSQFVAMGDSFSSGEGVEPFTYDSSSGLDACDRSTAAYSQLLPDRISGLHSPYFVACSGAVTADLYKPNHSTNLLSKPGGGYQLEPPQMDALRSDTKLVTLTIGGNDLGFAGIMAKCVAVAGGGDPRCQTSAEAKALSARLAALSSSSDQPSGTLGAGNTQIYSWQKIIRDIHSKAPNARIAIAGYPQLVDPKGVGWIVNGSNRCIIGDDVLNGSGDPGSGSNSGPSVGLSIFKDEANWISAQIQTVNDAIRTAVADSGVTQASYIPVDSAFKGHALCDQNSWIHQISASGAFSQDLTFVWPGSLHPTADGQSKGYATSFAAALPSSF